MADIVSTLSMVPKLYILKIHCMNSVNNLVTLLLVYKIKLIKYFFVIYKKRLDKFRNWLF